MQPCRDSIPHLSELQAKFADVVFVGITNEKAAAVKPFVEKMGAKMDYRYVELCCCHFNHPAILSHVPVLPPVIWRCSSHDILIWTISLISKLLHPFQCGTGHDGSHFAAVHARGGRSGYSHCVCDQQGRSYCVERTPYGPRIRGRCRAGTGRERCELVLFFAES